MVMNRNKPSIIKDFTNMLKWVVIAGIVGTILWTYIEWKNRPAGSRVINLAKLERWEKFWDYAGWFGLVIAIVVCLVLIGIAVLFLGWVISKVRNWWLGSTLVDGKLIDNYSTVGEDGHIHQYTTLVDPEKMVNPATTIHRNGRVNVKDFGGSADPNQQAALARQVNQNRRQTELDRLAAQAAAASGGKVKFAGNTGKAPTKAQLQQQDGLFTQQTRNAALDGQIKEQRLFNLLQRNKPKEEAPPIEWEFVPFGNAFAHVTNRKDAILVGQNQRNGGIALWRFENDASVRVLGEPGSGKSVMITQTIYQLARLGHSVIVMGSQTTADFDKFDTVAQLVDTDIPGMFAHTLSTVFDGEYRRRISLIREYIPKDSMDQKYSALPDNVRKANPRVFIVVDEFTTQLTSIALKDSKEAEEIVNYVEQIAGNGRKVGIHLVLGDQLATVADSPWSSRMKGTIPRVICGPIPKGAGGIAAYGSEFPSRLDKSRHEMAWNVFTDDDPDGQRLVGWFIQPEITDMVARTASWRMPVHVDLGDVVERNDVKEQVTSDEELGPAVKALVARLVDDGYTSTNQMPTKETAEEYEVSVGTMKRAKSHLRKLWGES